MGPSDEQEVATFELPLDASPRRSGRAGGRGLHLPPGMLVQNVLWFCRLRWLVVVSVLAFGLVGLVGPAADWMGFRRAMLWPFATAGILAVTNVAFLLHARRLRRRPAAGAALGSLWAQIASDLLVLTGVVHFVGSLETYAPFAYLFHIVLACIFLSRRQSLAVTLLACSLYAGCVWIESTILMPPGGIFARGSLRDEFYLLVHPARLNFLMLLAILLVVWYLASRLAAMVRDRDARLAQANRRLIAAQAERSQHMLRTTHELKAPFAAIHANTQLLRKGYCGELSAPADDVITRIAARCERLAREIQEMLQLANLQSTGQRPASPASLDLADVVTWCAAQLKARADARRIAIETDAKSAPLTIVEDHLKMMLANLVSNAVTYSHDGGRVRLACAPRPRGGPRLTVADEGIGIGPDKLARIFDEYYRTNEAVQHNPESSGLGLAIVRAVARANRVRIRVTSGVGRGTTFELLFAPHGPAGGDGSGREGPG